MRTFVYAAALAVVASQAAAATWELDSYVDYPIYSGDQSGLYKTQGIAWNPERNEWITSWQYGLGRTTEDFTTLQTTGGVDLSTGQLIDGIPAELAALGFDHIGDIDVYNGVIYASLDSEAGDYQNGHIALFSATDLSYLGVLQPMVGSESNPHNDVASWVAVDGSAGLAYGKEWKSGNTINVYYLDTMEFKETLTMDMALRNIQGAKILGDTMYLAAHDSTKSVYSLDLLTGHVTELFQLPTLANAFNETEGIALRQLDDGTVEMWIEMIMNPNGNGDTDSWVRLYRYISTDAVIAPVPLPATLPLALAGLAGLRLLRRRK